ncbi:cytidylyltransferase domain-containing protein [Pseudomonas thivervalensis]|uniref:Acylneuraminate cytidylyltransferase n=1 Tax=Pseudomonas thivervalensis TaxID=86265 RepID=A0A176NHE5_9PSED|nr:acylneuraminate cytidylyltransferase family protein [Pseudomonas thivervalensis]AXA54961.1 acylneuraminate cytidylyltransferase [Pseudomonas thivervalensis]AXA60644.1 acylneuraminate cytidylyltransferase [Pseudomonas thivervalensis]OAB50558.1 acylneuraminate cytidylyltransferase [Pseudomonas thivervalensis]SDF91710.1 N-acylneuraminate cytidylyltransferase [Pseudomonas thivervalensis]
MKTYAFIFARGGSKGLPGKNIRTLAGTPLLAYSINVAKQVEGIDKVFVSTDCSKIAAIAIQYGAEVIERPEYLAADTAAEWKSWQHAIEVLEQRGDYFDVFLSLPATSPLRNASDVRKCLDSIEGADVVVTVTPAATNPYFAMLVRDDVGLSKLVCGDGTITRRQDAPAVYDMTGVAYVTRPSYIKVAKGLFDGRLKSVVIPRMRAVDVDDIYDFKMAEMFVHDENLNAD